jgi:hypothetical protein
MRFYLNPRPASNTTLYPSTKISTENPVSNPIAEPVVDGDLSQILIKAGGLLEAFSGEKPSCIALLPDLESALAKTGAIPSSLSELWRFYADMPSLSAEVAGLSDTARARLQDSQAAKERRRLADKKEGLYLQTGFVTNSSSRDKYIALIKEKGLNSIVVDMKDDYGRLRFSPQSAVLKELGVVGDRLDIEEFASQAKTNG